MLGTFVEGLKKSRIPSLCPHTSWPCISVDPLNSPVGSSSPVLHHLHTRGTMKSFLGTVATLSLAVSSVSAHYIATTFSLGAKKFALYEHIRRNTNNNSPVTGRFRSSTMWWVHRARNPTLTVRASSHCQGTAVQRGWEHGHKHDNSGHPGRLCLHFHLRPGRLSSRAVVPVSMRVWRTAGGNG